MRFPRVQLSARREVVFGLLALGVATFEWLRCPSFVRIILAHVDPGDTEFSSGYSDWAWLSLRRGMTEREVEAAIGPPLRKVKRLGEQVWAYRRSSADTSYWKREVWLRRDRVVGFDSELYFD